MTPEQINAAIAEACGWQHKRQSPTRNGNPLPWIADYWRHPIHHRAWNRHCRPKYFTDLSSMRQAHSDIGLYDPANREMRVKWVARLREVVARRCPVNKVGSPLVSDVDCILVEPHEFAEAFVLAFCKPEKSK